MAKGHVIPLLHLAHLIHRRRLATLTFFTTPLNAPFLRRSLAGTTAAVFELPFPENHDLPSGVESTDRLPSMSLFLPFVLALDQLRPHFEAALDRLPAVSFLISDSFLIWTKDSAARFGIPRMAFYGMGNFATVKVNTFFVADDPDRFKPLFDENPCARPLIEFFERAMRATMASDGVVVNSFYELESASFDHWNKKIGPKAWCVGPVSMARKKADNRSEVMRWLDSRSAANRPVVYVAFGTQAELSERQAAEIDAGLEMSGFDFLWVVRDDALGLGEGFEVRVAERGRVVREWAEQLEILRHGGVKGFVSHCRWNSVMEAVAAGVPILAWPMMPEQAFNAELVVEELRVGIRVPASDCGVVGKEEMERLVRELLIGEKGREAAERVKELGEAARKSVAPGGSSWCSLEMMIDEMSGRDAFGVAHTESILL